jgi:DNA-binding transcriptional LysR family regulator
MGCDVELRDLEAFLTAAQTGHFGRAAAARHLSQSALSKAIGRLEVELGVPLFDRPGRTVRLNRYGELLREHAEEAFRALDAGRAAVADAIDPRRGPVALAFIPTLGPRVVPRLIREFRAEHPRSRVQLSQGGAATVVEMLRSGHVDLALTSPAPTWPEVQWTPLWTERLVLVTASEQDQPPPRRPVRLEAYRDRPFAALKTGYGLRTITDELFRRAGFTPRVVFEGSDVPTVRGLVGAGLGIAVLPPADGADDGWSPSELEIADDSAQRTIGIAAVRDRYLPATARALYDHLVSEAGRRPRRPGHDRTATTP